jgi:hypothetical protein
LQTKLHRWAGRDPRRRFDDLYNLVADPAFLVVAWNRVRVNKGARSAGVDGIAPRSVGPAAGVMLAALRDDLKARRFIPAPVRPAEGMSGARCPLVHPHQDTRACRSAQRQPTARRRRAGPEADFSTTTLTRSLPQHLVMSLGDLALARMTDPWRFRPTKPTPRGSCCTVPNGYWGNRMVADSIDSVPTQKRWCIRAPFWGKGCIAKANDLVHLTDC